ncbi:MAG: GAF domain-containing protein [Geodermatophilaceae bacterium]|nr:GAF domain-containing protein [Geodermatophilaceae bacterium]
MASTSPSTSWATSWPPWLPTVLTGFFVAATALSGTQVGTTEGTAQTVWVAVQVVSAVAAFAVPTAERVRRDRRRRAAEALELSARTELRLAMNDALDPVVRQIGRIATAAVGPERDALREQAIPFVLTAATQVIGPDRTRACWFVLESGPPRLLQPVASVGRAGPPRTEFVTGTPRGDAALAMIERDEQYFCRDVDEEPPLGWVSSGSHEYRTFVAVPVTAGNTAFGMLTIDAPNAGDLTGDDAGLLRLR